MASVLHVVQLVLALLAFASAEVLYGTVIVNDTIPIVFSVFRLDTFDRTSYYVSDIAVNSDGDGRGNFHSGFNPVTQTYWFSSEGTGPVVYGVNVVTGAPVAPFTVEANMVEQIDFDITTNSAVVLGYIASTYSYYLFSYPRLGRPVFLTNFTERPLAAVDPYKGVYHYIVSQQQGSITLRHFALKNPNATTDTVHQCSGINPLALLFDSADTYVAVDVSADGTTVTVLTSGKPCTKFAVPFAAEPTTYTRVTIDRVLQVVFIVDLDFVVSVSYLTGMNKRVDPYLTVNYYGLEVPYSSKPTM